jgi:uncharacterized OB-fold protein
MSAHRDASVDFDGRVDAPHWNGLAEGEVRIQRCLECEEWHWPADWRCWKCGSFELGWEAVEPAGVVFTWCRTYYEFVPSHKDLLPYVNVLVELPGAGGRRVLGLLVGNEEGLKIGAKVEGFIEEPSELSGELYVLRWRLVTPSRELENR